MAERLKAHAWKACEWRELLRGFESLSLRQCNQFELLYLLSHFFWVKSMKKDYKKDLEEFCYPSRKEVSVVAVPKMNFLMIDGKGDPGICQGYNINKN